MIKAESERSEDVLWRAFCDTSKALAGEGEGAVDPSVAVSPCSFLNGIEWEGRRQTRGDVAATSLLEPIIGGDVTTAYVRNLTKIVRVLSTSEPSYVALDDT